MDRGHHSSYCVPSEIFEKHEYVFFKLIFNTKKDEEIEHDFGITINPEFIRKMNEVFGSRPSVANLRSFFSNEAIQGLWNDGFAVEASAGAYRGLIQQD